MTLPKKCGILYSEAEVTIIIKLDYTLTSKEDRLALVNKILEENPDPSPSYLEILADYLIVPVEKEERRERKLLTENRMATINKRETSFEGLVSQLENGEDGIYNLVHEDKSQILQPKVSITKQDLEDIPYLKQIKEAIAMWETLLKTAQGRDKYVIKKAIIELRKDQYVIKNAFKPPVNCKNIIKSRRVCKLDDGYSFDEDGYVIPEGVSLCNPIICSAVLCNYSGLKQDSWGDFEGDLWYFMEDFDRISSKALEPYPLYEEIVTCKIDGMQNIDIQERLQEKFGIKHSLEYISSLWRKKIPMLIASEAEDELLEWHFLNVEKGKWKRCSRCGQVKLAHNKYFSKNKTSKDGFYSICKCCRNSKAKKK